MTIENTMIQSKADLIKILDKAFDKNYTSNQFEMIWFSINAIRKLDWDLNIQKRDLSWYLFSFKELFLATEFKFRSLHNRLELNLGADVERIISKMISNKNPSAINVLYYGLQNIGLKI